jgi:HAMP domain-containing protein
MGKGNDGQMPEGVRDVYDPLNKVAITTHYHWQLMLQLYDGKERADLLNRFGGIVFGRIQQMMLADVVLGICRLTDPATVPSNPKKQSLSIPRLIETVVADAFDLRLMPSLNDESEIPADGKNLIIIGAVDDVLHFRFFDGDGKVVVNTDEKRLTEQTRPIEDLRKQLGRLWPPHEPTRIEKDQVINAVTSIVGYNFLNLPEMMKELGAASKSFREMRNRILAHRTGRPGTNLVPLRTRTRSRRHSA